MDNLMNEVKNKEISKNYLPISRGWMVTVILQVVIFALFSPLFLGFIGLISNDLFNEGERFYPWAFYYAFVFGGPLLILSLVIFYKSIRCLWVVKYTPYSKNFYLVLVSLFLAILMQAPLAIDSLKIIFGQHKLDDEVINDYVDQFNSKLNL